MALLPQGGWASHLVADDLFRTFLDLFLHWGGKDSPSKEQTHSEYKAVFSTSVKHQHPCTHRISQKALSTVWVLASPTALDLSRNSFYSQESTAVGSYPHAPPHGKLTDLNWKVEWLTEDSVIALVERWYPELKKFCLARCNICFESKLLCSAVP